VNFRGSISVKGLPRREKENDNGNYLQISKREKKDFPVERKPTPPRGSEGSPKGPRKGRKERDIERRGAWQPRLC